ncbi:MAG: calcium/sodium antiporter [bacterium]
MLLSIAAVIAGFALLVWGADQFVNGAAGLARNLGVPPLLIGLTIVGFGTSAPEILVAIMASTSGTPGLAIGNAIGSNIANIGLIIGITALLVPLSVHSDILRKEFPLLLIASFGAFWVVTDLNLSRLNGFLLLAGLVVTFMLVIRIGIQRKISDPLYQEYQEEFTDDRGVGSSIGIFLVGLVVLLVSSRLLVWGAENIAREFGVSDLVIGLTIVAIGTSLPELAASVASAYKKEHDIAVGNVLGSNLYNMLAVLPVPALIAPGAVPPELLSRDLPLMLGLTLALYLMSTGINGQGRINRYEAAVLLACFIGYQYWVYLDAMAVPA